MKDFIIKHWITVFFGAIGTAATTVLARARAQREATKAILICLILQMHETYTRRGYILASELKVVEDLNTNYKALGGNGTAKALMADIEALPNNPQKSDKKTTEWSS